MAGTTISELGKMFNQSTQSVQGTESNTRITTGKVDFGSMTVSYTHLLMYLRSKNASGQ